MKNSEQAVNVIGLLFGVCVTFWAKNLADFLQPSMVHDRGVGLWLLLLLAGVLFLIDILCVLWWFSKYVYRIKPTTTLSTFFVDFMIVGAFALASDKWHQQSIFLTATVCGSILLCIRFGGLYHDPDATDTDRQILSKALVSLGVAFLVSGTALAFVLISLQTSGTRISGDMIAVLVSCFLSSIGLWLTFTCHDKIAVAVDIHARTDRRFIPMDLHWPSTITCAEGAKQRITQNTAKGLERFRKLFIDTSKDLIHERVTSRVHSEADLRVQSYILPVPSWSQDKQREVEDKAFMVAVSHWLDDLLDGRNEVSTYRRVKERLDLVMSVPVDEKPSLEAFNLIYKDEIVKHKNNSFIGRSRRKSATPPFWMQTRSIFSGA